MFLRLRSRMLLMWATRSWSVSSKNRVFCTVLVLLLTPGAALRRPQLVTPPATVSEACDLETQLCNTVENKVPAVPRELPKSVSTEHALSIAAKEDFEHALGHGLAASAAVQGATHEFAARLFVLIVQGSRMTNNQSETEALLEAFIPKCDAHNTGFIGPFPDKIKHVLTVEGNIREVWGLVYCLSKNKHKLDALFHRLPDSFHFLHLGPAAGAQAIAAIASRSALIRKTQRLQVDSYTWGVPDFIFPPLDSWARFAFTAKTANGSKSMWRGARKFAGGCHESQRFSDDPVVQPPLSAAELTVQCSGEPRCKLQWYPGKGCFYLVDAPLGSKPSYLRLSEALGYRTAAAPSATTANVLQLALLLGFTREDLVIFRAAMVAWMLPVDDHSLFEILLGADPFMPPALRLHLDHTDLEQLWPRNFTMQASWGPVFTAAGIWGPVSAQLTDEQGELRGEALNHVRAALPIA
mmetsp:Transcript_86296/g.200656  ORF Transcript_86296/g.200656 Transcript_86296/m.200656 type:complete len:467 (+) Transcript_86296:76-1476(+)